MAHASSNRTDSRSEARTWPARGRDLGVAVTGSLRALRTQRPKVALSTIGLGVVVSVGLLLPSVSVGGIPVAYRTATSIPRQTMRIEPRLDDNATTSACDGQPPSPGEHCLPLPVELILQTKSDAHGCAQALFMQVPLRDDVTEYGAAWGWTQSDHPWLFTATGGRDGSGSGPYGEEVWSTKAITPQNSGVNVHYLVPKGDGAWFVSAGGGPGPCTGKTGLARGWAWTAHPVVSGQITLDDSSVPIEGFPVRASCPGGGTTITDSDGDYGCTLDPGHCTIAPQPKPGDVSFPAQRAVDVVAADIKNVDFQVVLSCRVVAQFDTSRGVAVPAYVLASSSVPNGTYKGNEREEYNSPKCQPDSLVATVSGGKITVKWYAYWLCQEGTRSTGETQVIVQGGPVTVGANGQFTVEVSTLVNGAEVHATITGVVTSSGVTITDASGSLSAQLDLGGRACNGGVENVSLK